MRKHISFYIHPSLWPLGYACISGVPIDHAPSRHGELWSLVSGGSRREIAVVSSGVSASGAGPLDLLSLTNKLSVQPHFPAKSTSNSDHDKAIAPDHTCCHSQLAPTLHNFPFWRERERDLPSAVMIRWDRTATTKMRTYIQSVAEWSNMGLCSSIDQCPQTRPPNMDGTVRLPQSTAEC